MSSTVNIPFSHPAAQCCIARLGRIVFTVVHLSAPFWPYVGPFFTSEYKGALQRLDPLRKGLGSLAFLPGRRARSVVGLHLVPRRLQGESRLLQEACQRLVLGSVGIAGAGGSPLAACSVRRASAWRRR